MVYWTDLLKYMFYKSASQHESSERVIPIKLPQWLISLQKLLCIDHILIHGFLSELKHIVCLLFKCLVEPYFMSDFHPSVRQQQRCNSPINMQTLPQTALTLSYLPFYYEKLPFGQLDLKLWHVSNSAKQYLLMC